MGEPTPRPRWRWWLHGVALWIAWHTEWAWAWKLMSWCILPEWLMSRDDFDAMMENDRG